ncbi:MAG: hypothetical protein ACI85K_000578 [Hyphomicrobiaceae bacterium]|jgi:hypothetical protein
MPSVVVAQAGGHWAYEPPAAVRSPAVEDAGWARSPVDAFVLAEIERNGQRPAPEADVRTLARRLFFDLVGLPPEMADVEALAADASGEGYQRLVDRLLASPHFAERMAMYWLDLVRFADSTGVHADNPWDAHPYRDWVIQAFDQNMPFDRFTREQLAGDLMSDATLQQRVAAAYNRLNLVTREGGSQPKEFLIRYTADRVRNVSTVWMAATVGCAECHDHKFDPIAARDFYRLGAFFADIEQVGVYSQGAAKGRYFGPYLTVPPAEQRGELVKIDKRIATARDVLATPTDALADAQREWEREVLAAPPVAPEFGAWHAAGPYAASSFADAHKRAFGPENGVDLAAQHEGSNRWTKHAEWLDGKAHKLAGDRSAFYLFRTITVARAQQLTLHFGSDDSIRVWVDGESVLDHQVSRGVAPDQERLDLDFDVGQHELLVKIANGSGSFGFYFRPEFARLPDGLLVQLRVPVQSRTADGAAAVSTHFRGLTPLLADARRQLRELEAERAALVDSLPVVIATVATEPMTTRVLRRGDWMDDSGEVVQPGVPAAFGALAARPQRATRLDLANWLVQPDNPLVARVFVNRLWKLFFGRGIVRTLDDFGTQGARPTHPELLDYLAHRFVESGWDVKAMIRLMVTSATYRQSSDCDPITARDDPYNTSFSRQVRYRHDAEIVRDNALAVSGLLVKKVGGRSVRPYQPVGFYRHLNFPKRRYQQGTGDDLWRRSIYTHWQRQYLHPALAAFDAPSREECTVERARSNTPLQALVLLNDPILVEAARALATRMVREGGSDVREQIAFAGTTVLNRSLGSAEFGVLLNHHQRLREQYAADVDAAKALLAIGEWPVPADIDPTKLAALTGVARVILSLHETLTRY